jgi:hypothetical protein
MSAIILRRGEARRRRRRQKRTTSGSGTSEMPNMYEQQAIPMDKNVKREEGGRKIFCLRAFALLILSSVVEKGRRGRSMLPFLRAGPL